MRRTQQARQREAEAVYCRHTKRDRVTNGERDAWLYGLGLLPVPKLTDPLTKQTEWDLRFAELRRSLEPQPPTPTQA